MKLDHELWILRKTGGDVSVSIRNKRRYCVVKTKLLLMFLCSASLLACSVPTRIILTNASTEPITLSYKEEGRRTLRLAMNPNAEVEITSLFSRSFTIRKQDSDFVYEGQMPPEDFIEHVGTGPFFKRLAKAQLENNGCIYLIPVKDEPRDHVHAVQPEGFPLCPKKP